MKKIIAIIVLVCMVISFSGCTNTAAANNETENSINIKNFTDNPISTIDGKFENYLKNAYGDNRNFYIYDTDKLTSEILENRTYNDGIIVERCIGIVTNIKGDGIILNSKDYMSINYHSVNFTTNVGTLIVSYLIYNPETNSTDDVINRYDFLLSRSMEKLKIEVLKV